MDRGNKKESVAAFHRERILAAAETVFTEKGYDRTTIDDISKASEYSRRTLYAYYEGKEDILYHIIAKGLAALKTDVEAALRSSDDFFIRYDRICGAMQKYHAEYPHSMEYVIRAKTEDIPMEQASPVLLRILSAGTEINERLAEWISQGKEEGIVRQDVHPMKTVYILWSDISALLTMVQTKGGFLEKNFNETAEEFLQYGLRQILRSILAA